jgi:hypothetical protein
MLKIYLPVGNQRKNQLLRFSRQLQVATYDYEELETKTKK